MKKRKTSFEERSAILLHLKVIYFEKQKYSKAFFKSIVKYFTDFVELYQSYLKANSKFELKKKPKDIFIYGALYESIL